MSSSNYVLHAHLSDVPPRQVPFPRWGQGIVGLQLTSKISLQVGSDIVSEAGLHPCTIRIANVAYSAVGIGGIRTGSSWRRQGYGTLVTHTAISVAVQRWRPDVLALFTLENTKLWYATRFGLAGAEPESTWIAQPNDQTVPISNGVTLMLSIGTASQVKVESLPW